MALLFLLMVAWCILAPPDVSVRPTDPTAREFALEYRGVNKVLSVIVYSETRKEYLWIIRPNALPTKLQYGFRGDARQTFPFQDRDPKALSKNETLVLCIVFQYDQRDPPVARVGER